MEDDDFVVTMDTELRPLPTATRHYICPTCGRLDSHEEPGEGDFEPANETIYVTFFF